LPRQGFSKFLARFNIPASLNGSTAIR